MRVPVECSRCGAFTLTPYSQPDVLLAVCDVLVLKALEAMGKWIVRVDRARFKVLDGRPFHLAHTLWQADDVVVTKALRGAWDVVPAMLSAYGCCGVTLPRITSMLDGYVHDLVVSGTPHTKAGLSYRFTAVLGLAVEWDGTEESSDHLEGCLDAC